MKNTFPVRLPWPAPAVALRAPLVAVCLWMFCGSGSPDALDTQSGPSSGSSDVIDEVIPRIRAIAQSDRAEGSNGATYRLRRNARGGLRKLRLELRAGASAPGAIAGTPGPDAVDWSRRATAFLEKNRELLDLPPLEDLVPAKKQDSDLGAVPGRSLDFDQQVMGQPLFGAGLRVWFDDSGELSLLFNNTIAGISAPARSTRPGLSAEQAVAAARELVELRPLAAPGQPLVADLGWVLVRLPVGQPMGQKQEPDRPDGGATEVDEASLRQVWRVGNAAAFVLIDASSGAALWTESLRRDITHRAKVFAENGVATPTLTEVELARLEVGDHLAGTFVDVQKPSPSVRASDRTVWSFAKSSAAFGQVMVYHQVDGALVWLRERGFRPRKTPIRVTTRAFDELNAYFDPSQDALFFGHDESLDVASDGDVVVHELGHAVVHAYAPRLLGGDPRSADGAIHEGYGDLLACLYHRNARSSEALHKRLHDTGRASAYLTAIGSKPSRPGRPCDADRRYPADVDADPHIAGMIVSSTLWDLVTSLGRGQKQADGERLAMAALQYLVPSHNDYGDLLEAVLEADRALRTERKAEILAAFRKHGIDGESSAKLPSNSTPGLPWISDERR